MTKPTDRWCLWLWMTLLLCGLMAACGVPALAQTDHDRTSNWPQWRGPLGTGVAPEAEPPIEWGVEQNVRWKVELPGRGHSTPVVWGDRLFLTAAVPVGEKLEPTYSGAPGAHDNLPVTRRHKFLVLAVRRRDGKILWQRSVHEALPHEGGHYTASLASASPVVDQHHLLACFGSYGVYCLDHQGQPQWQRQLGQMQTKHGHGEGSSPALHGETLIVNWDHEGQSFVLALDKTTGQQRWKVEREEVTSWATPLVVPHGGRFQVIVPGTRRIRSYDLSNGEMIWQCGGLSANIVASPVAAAGIVYAGSSYNTRAMLAIRLDGAQGDVTDSDHVVWRRNQRTPYVPSPLLYGEGLYFLGHYQGILTRLDAKTGEEPTGPFRLSDIRSVYASPVGAAGRIYLTDRDGATMVLSAGQIPRVLAVNRLDDVFSASMALVQRQLFLRGETHLYCIAEK